MDFSTMLQDMVRSTPTPSLHSAKDRQETPKNKNKREDNLDKLMNEIGLAIKRR